MLSTNKTLILDPGNFHRSAFSQKSDACSYDFDLCRTGKIFRLRKNYV